MSSAKLNNQVNVLTKISKGGQGGRGVMQGANGVKLSPTGRTVCLLASFPCKTKVFQNSEVFFISGYLFQSI